MTKVYSEKEIIEIVSYYVDMTCTFNFVYDSDYKSQKVSFIQRYVRPFDIIEIFSVVAEIYSDDTDTYLSITAINVNDSSDKWYSIIVL